MKIRLANDLSSREQEYSDVAQAVLPAPALAGQAFQLAGFELNPAPAHSHCGMYHCTFALLRPPRLESRSRLGGSRLESLRYAVPNSAFSSVATLVVLLLLICVSSTKGQAALDFCNYNLAEAIDAPVYDVDRSTGLGGQFLGQIYAGTTAANLVPIGLPSPFRNFPGTSAGSGYVIAVRVDVPKALLSFPDISLYVELRAWAVSGGSSYETAVAAGAKAGRSGVFQANPLSQLTPPGPLIGLQSFSLTSAANKPPVSSGFGATTQQNQPLLLTYASLLAPVSDPDGAPVHMVSAGTNEIRLEGELLGTVELSTNGALVVANDDRVVYIPNADFVGA